MVVLSIAVSFREVYIHLPLSTRQGQSSAGQLCLCYGPCRGMGPWWAPVMVVGRRAWTWTWWSWCWHAILTECFKFPSYVFHDCTVQFFNDSNYCEDGLKKKNWSFQFFLVKPGGSDPIWWAYVEKLGSKKHTIRPPTPPTFNTASVKPPSYWSCGMSRNERLWDRSRCLTGREGWLGSIRLSPTQ